MDLRGGDQLGRNGARGRGGAVSADPAGPPGGREAWRTKACTGASDVNQRRFISGGPADWKKRLWSNLARGGTL